jgi:hypothetical protein
MHRAGAVRVPAHDGASVIDPEGNGVYRARDVDGGKAAPLPQKAVVYAGAVRVLAHDGASVIDSRGFGAHRARDPEDILGATSGGCLSG